MVSEKLKKLLNKGIAREIQVSIQYVWQHVLATGIKGVAIEGIFKEIAITEMKHAESIAERLAYLGGTPTTKPDPIFVGGSLEEMIRNDVKAEEGDITTKRLFEEILGDEEGHLDTFINLLKE